MFVGPVGDADQGLGMTQAGGRQKRQDLAVRELQLGIGWEMLVEDVGEVELFEQRGDQGQGSEVKRDSVGGGREERKTHGISMPEGL